MLFRICLTLVMGGQSLTINLFLKKHIDKSRRLSTPKIYNYIISGMNRVPMARHGLILRENEATGSRKVFKYLLGLQDTILSPKLLDKVPTSQKSKTPYFTVYSHIDCISCLGSHAGIIFIFGTKSDRLS